MFVGFTCDPNPRSSKCIQSAHQAYMYVHVSSTIYVRSLIANVRFLYQSHALIMTPTSVMESAIHVHVHVSIPLCAKARPDLILSPQMSLVVVPSYYSSKLDRLVVCVVRADHNPGCLESAPLTSYNAP